LYVYFFFLQPDGYNIKEIMARMKILISGGGMAGNALASWLSKLGHDVAVIERFPSLRAEGQLC
jgi:NADPH-dependent 2,4-dienoyl-CoA reductase/sulfur reductase-like enzyme